MTRDIGGQTMVKCGVNLSRDAAVGEQFWQAEVVCDAPPPSRDWCDRGGHGQRWRHCVIGADIIGHCRWIMCLVSQKYPFVVP